MKKMLSRALCVTALLCAFSPLTARAGDIETPPAPEPPTGGTTNSSPAPTYPDLSKMTVEELAAYLLLLALLGLPIPKP